MNAIISKFTVIFNRYAQNQKIGKTNNLIFNMLEWQWHGVHKCCLFDGV